MAGKRVYREAGHLRRCPNATRDQHPTVCRQLTSDGVHSDGRIVYKGEEAHSGEDHVSTSRPDAGGAALIHLRDSRPLFTTVIKDVGIQSADGSSN